MCRDSSANQSGGSVTNLNTWKLKLSQYDHITKNYIKKTLKERWHNLGGIDSGIQVHRDIYSAFLAYATDETGNHLSNMDECWKTIEPYLKNTKWYRYV